MMNILIRMTDMLYGVSSKSFEYVISLVLNTSRKKANLVLKHVESMYYTKELCLTFDGATTGTQTHHNI